MSLTFDYGCHNCGKTTTNKEMDSFSCKCGGTFRIIDKFSFEPSIFEPHYNEVIQDYVTSWKDMENKGKKYRSAQRPNGFIVTDPRSKFMRELKYIHKHKEDYTQSLWAKDGKRYKPGSKVKLDEKSGEFVPMDGHGSRNRGRTYFFGK